MIFNKSYFWIGVAVVIVGVIAYFALNGNLNLSSFQTGGSKTSVKPSVAVVSGGSLVSPSGQVVDRSGAPVRLDVESGSPNAPQQSDPISKDILPRDSIKLTVTASGFLPNSFIVKAGKVMTLSLTSGDSQTHIFKFDSQALSAVAIGVGPGETRAITFNAPKQAGEYRFHDDVPGHAGRGEIGVMVVK